VHDRDNTDPLFSLGDHVTVASVGGNTAANQTAVAVTGVKSRQFWYASANYYLYDSVGSFSSGGGGVVSVNVNSHGLSTSNQVQFVESGGTVNGIYTITVVDSNNFTLNGSGLCHPVPFRMFGRLLEKVCTSTLTSIVAFSSGCTS